jgi:Uma2 family endonuclease
MSTVHTAAPFDTRDYPRSNGYPTWASKPMPETDWHRDLMNLLIEVLRDFYAGQPVYVTGNILVFYQQGNRRRHVSPDVWLARGVDNHPRPNYLIWEESHGPEFVIELTSRTTQNEDLNSKFTLYRDVLEVREYFLFDPDGDYLQEQLQGYRLRKGAYQRIHARHGRLPSQVTGLHLEAEGNMLRLWNPLTATWLPTPQEVRQGFETATEQLRGTVEQLQAENQQLRQRATALEAELQNTNRRLDELARRLDGNV